MPEAGVASPYRLLDCGDRALAVEFGREIDPAVNARVVALDRALASSGLPGLVETVPTYRSLLVLYDPDVLARQTLAGWIADHWPPPDHGSEPVRRWRVPVCYGGEHGMDLDALAERTGLTTAEVVTRHLAPDYRVYMIGFAPGFAYLGVLDPTLHVSRRTTPRPTTPAGSVSIGGAQTAISPPLELPSGWHMIGRTPVRSYDPGRATPFLFAAGDLIRFEPIDLLAFERLSEAASGGAVVAECEACDG